ncbi:MBOAT family O-acyltransferase [Desulfocurvus sp. DL9XJH121]
MNLVSPEFIGLVFALASLSAILPGTLRPYLILAISLAFYGSFNWAFLPLLLGVILVTWGGGFAIQRSGQSKTVTGLCVVLAASPLAFYKYLLVWFPAAAGFLPKSDLYFGGYGDVLVPVGLSFFTFQAIGYLIDIHRRAYDPEANLAHVALFLSFFPQLLAGPIERFAQLAPQLKTIKRPSPDMLLSGLTMLLYGLFLKLVLGDRIAIQVDKIYGNIDVLGAGEALLGCATFTLQLFADFAGYSFIALGAAALFGVRLTQNFKQPFFSANLVEFWQRWHISLTRWIGDYLYRPLARRLVREKGLSRFQQEALTLLVVWTAMGLWHGATMVYVTFGLSQALTMILLKRFTRPGRRPSAAPWRTALGMLATLLFVCLTFGLLRAPSLGAYGQMLHSILTLAPDTLDIDLGKYTPLLLALVLGVEAARRFAPRLTLETGVWRRCCAMAALSLGILLFTYSNEYHAAQNFIYFRF